MPTKTYTNVAPPMSTNTDHSYIVRTSRRPESYIAQRGQGLTLKEKAARKQSKTGAYTGMGNMGGGSMGSSGVTSMANHGNFFSYQMSPDFLEQPQSAREEYETYRAIYNHDELVAQAIDLHTELPLSKVRLSTPKPRICPEGFDSPEDYGKYILSRFERMCNRIELFDRLLTMVHHYWLDGACVVFAEDSGVEVPEDVGFDTHRVKQATLNEDGTVTETVKTHRVARDTQEDEVLEYYSHNYQGWNQLIVLPIDQIELTTLSLTGKQRIQLIPSDADRDLLEKANAGDEAAQEMASSLPADVVPFLAQGGLIPLGTDPDEGSFAYVFKNSKAANSPRGQSILARCMRTILYREKLRQAQVMIATRAMTPKRIVWAEGASVVDIDTLREQVDMALEDPDYSIIANFEVHWEEMGSRDRLLDLSSEYEQTEKRLITGLGVTESLMSGESLYSGDRLKLSVINERYINLREDLKRYVQEKLFKPVARRMGFVEQDKWGQEVVLFPELSFTRIPLRDSQDTFDALMNLYQKGSISVDLILEVLNIDPSDTRAKIEQDMGTVNDALFNEVLRSVYSEVGRELATKTDIVSRTASYMGLTLKPESEEDDGGGGGGRFG